MQTYSIIINETQRKIILNALQQGKLKDKEAITLKEIVKNLPEEEKTNPQVLHGLCY